MLLRIDGQSFRIDPDQNTDALRADVLRASQRTEYVHFLALGGGQVSVLVGARTSASFEVHDHAQGAPDGTYVEAETTDLDLEYARSIAQWEQA